MEASQFTQQSNSTAGDFALPADNTDEFVAYNSRLPPLPFIPDHLRELIIEKRYWWRTSRKSGHPASKKMFNMYTRSVKLEIQNIRNQLEIDNAVKQPNRNYGPFIPFRSEDVTEERYNAVLERLGKPYQERLAAFFEATRVEQGGTLAVMEVVVKHHDVAKDFAAAFNSMFGNVR